MRCFIAVLLLLAGLTCSRDAEALSCTPLPSASWFRAVDDSALSEEQQHQDAEARAALERVDHTPIIFRGRVVSARYLPDPRKGKSNTSTALLVFDQVEILKGRFYRSPADRKAFIIHHGWCDGGCEGKEAGTRSPRGTTVVLGVYPNSLANPSRAVDFDSKQVVYKGRIDATLGMCSGGSLSSIMIEMLNAPGEEIERLKREYVIRPPGERL